MKNYSIYIFSSKECPPCQRLNSFINTLPSEQIASLQVVPMKTESGTLTALAEECSVSLTPTLVAVHHDVVCEQSDDEEWCDQSMEIVETIVGATNIITALPSTISAYTYTEAE